jgi:hypothetical protein
MKDRAPSSIAIAARATSQGPHSRQAQVTRVKSCCDSALAITQQQDTHYIFSASINLTKPPMSRTVEIGMSQFGRRSRLRLIDA